MPDPEFDQYNTNNTNSMGRSTARSSHLNTMRRTKYHLVSNDYTDSTKPTAPTPVAKTLSQRSSNFCKTKIFKFSFFT
jgi:hypothetical protein